MRLGLAFKVFFAALFDADAATRLAQALVQATPTETKPEVKPIAQEPKPVAPVKPKGRSEAITLLAALQREARFLDIVKEPLGSYTDVQVGAAARDVLRNCGTVLERFFELQPVISQDEGSNVEVPRGYDPQRFRLVGNISGEPPFHGQLVHHGWSASKCELPEWTGSPAAALVIAPVEVEVGVRS